MQKPLKKQREWREYCIRGLKAHGVLYELTAGGAYKFKARGIDIVVADLSGLTAENMDTLTRGLA